jgi:hypothetical protein
LRGFLRRCLLGLSRLMIDTFGVGALQGIPI